MRYYAVVLVLFPLALLSCKDENKYRWTEIDVDLKEVLTNELPDSIHFFVEGHKESLNFWESSISKGEGSIEIDDYIIDGKYSGGFLASSNSRWNYILRIQDDFLDSFYVIAPFDKYYFPWNIEKRKINNYHLTVSKNQQLAFKTHLSSCTQYADNISVQMKHKVFEPYFDLSPGSEDWVSGSFALRFLGCDTVMRNYLYPPGEYEVAIKTIVHGNETGYYLKDFTVYEDSINVLELYY